MELIERIIHSKKAFYAMVPVTVNVIAAVAGVDVTQPAMLLLDAAFAGLALTQFALDMRWGSKSDGSAIFDHLDLGDDK